LSINQPPGKKKAMSTAAAAAKISDVVLAESPTCSAHSGSRPVRRERLAAMITTAAPRVSSVRRCALSTETTDRCAVAPRCSEPKSGMVRASSADARDIAAASQKTQVSAPTWIRPAPSSGPISTPTRMLPPSPDMARAR
jgi:hypothetical protein